MINCDVYIKRVDVSKMHRLMIRYTFFNLAATTWLLSCQRVWNELRANYTITIWINAANDDFYYCKCYKHKIKNLLKFTLEYFEIMFMIITWRVLVLLDMFTNNALARDFRASDNYCDPDCYSYMKPGNLMFILIIFVIIYINI